MRRSADAEGLYRQALQIWEQKGDAHQVDVARYLNNLAALYRKQKRLDEAILLLREALTKWEKAEGETRAEWAMGAANLSAVLCEAREFGEAESLLRRAILSLQEFVSEDHPDLTWMLSNYVDLLRQTGRPDDAKHIETALRDRRHEPSGGRGQVVDLSELLTFRKK